MSAKHTPGVGPLGGPFGSGTHWAGAQTVTRIQLSVSLALEEALSKRRKLSPFPRDAIAKATGSAS